MSIPRSRPVGPTAGDTADTDGVDAILAQWRREQPGLDVSPMDVIARIMRLSRELEARLEPVFATYGLEPGWFDVLAALRRSGSPYRLRAKDLAAALMLTSSGTTKRLDRLESAGLIAREPDPDDRRGVLIVLTRRGRAVVERAVTHHVANEHGLLGGLDKSEQRQLASLLRKLQLSLPPSDAVLDAGCASRGRMVGPALNRSRLR